MTYSTRQRTSALIAAFSMVALSAACTIGVEDDRDIEDVGTVEQEACTVPIWLGDVNGNGSFSSADANFNNLSCLQRIRADVTGSGRSVTNADRAPIYDAIEDPSFSQCDFPKTNRIPGDADGNNRVNGNDVSHMNAVLSNPHKQPDLNCGTLRHRVDLNCDGEYDYADRTILSNCINGSISALPNCTPPCN